MGDKKRFEVFISYSTDPDEVVAEALERELKRFLRPWYRPGPRFRVFRDATDLSPGAGLTAKIDRGLSESKHMVALLSPNSANPGGWLDKEVDKWLALKEQELRESPPRRGGGVTDDAAEVARTITPVVTVWPASAAGAEPTDLPNLRDFRWDGADVAPSLRTVYAEPPLAVDLRWAHASSAAGSLTLDDADFREAVTSIAAGVLGVPRTEFDAVVRSMKRRAFLLITTILTALLMLLVTIVFNYQLRRDAEAQRDRARQEQRDAEDATLVAERNLAGVQADLDRRQRDLDETQAALNSTRDELDLAEENLLTTQDDLDRATTRLDDATAQLQQATDDRDAALAEVELATAAREQALAARDAAQAEVDRLGDELQGLEDAVDAAEQLLAATNEQLAAARSEAERQLGIADARRLSGLALAALPTDLAKASLLAIEAADRTGRTDVAGFRTPGLLRTTRPVDSSSVTSEARDALLRTLQRDPRLLAVVHGVDEPIRTLAVSADGTVLAGAGDGFVQFWDPVSLQRTRRLATTVSASSSIALDPAGETVAVGTGEYSGTVRLLDAETGAVQRTLRLDASSMEPRALTFSDDGRWLASGAVEVIAGDATEVVVWDLANGSRVTVPETQNAVSLDLDPDGTILAVADVFGFRVFERQGGDWAATASYADQVERTARSVAIQPGGSRVVGTLEDGSVVMLDTRTEEQALVIDLGVDERVTAMAFADDGTLYAAGDSGRRLVRLRLPDADEPLTDVWVGEEIDSWDVGQVDSLVLTRNRPMTAGPDEPVRVWDPDRDVPFARSVEHSTVGVQPGGRLVALLRGDGGVDLADVATLQVQAILPAPTPATRLTTVSIAETGDRAVSVDSVGAVTVWDTRTGQRIRRLVSSALPDGALDVAISADGALAAAASSSAVAVWSIDDGRPVASFGSDPGIIVHVEFTRDGRVAVASGDEVALWQLDPPAQVTTRRVAGVRGLAADRTDSMLLVALSDRVLRLSTADLRTVTEYVAPREQTLNAVAVSADGTLIAAGADRSSSFSSGVVVVWDAASRQVAASPLEGHRGLFGEGPSQVWFGEGGRLVSSGASGPPTRIWELDVNAWIELACRRANRNLTQVEWADALPSAPYRTTCPSFPPGG